LKLKAILSLLLVLLALAIILSLVKLVEQVRCLLLLILLWHGLLFGLVLDIQLRLIVHPSWLLPKQLIENLVTNVLSPSVKFLNSWPRP
jgi:hypothetical protein